MVAVGDFHTAESFPDSVPGGPPPPLRNENRHGSFQASLDEKQQRLKRAPNAGLQAARHPQVARRPHLWRLARIISVTC
jgi:hypothetical protein